MSLLLDDDDNDDERLVMSVCVCVGGGDGEGCAKDNGDSLTQRLVNVSF